MKKITKNFRLILTFIYIAVAIAIGLSAMFFNQLAKQISWNNSVNSITELNKQQTAGLSSILENSYNLIHEASLEFGRVANISDAQKIMSVYHMMDSKLMLYFSDGSVAPYSVKGDQYVQEKLVKSARNEGIIDPHLNSSSGLTVCNVYEFLSLGDGVRATLVKELELNKITNDITQKFFNGRGFSYLVKDDGSILFGPLQDESKITAKNIFDVADVKSNGELVEQFRFALNSGKSDWLIMNIANQQYFIAYRPVGKESSWLLLSMVPVKVMTEGSVVLRNFILFAQLITALFFLLLSIWFYRNFRTFTNLSEKRVTHNDHLFDCVQEGLILMQSKKPYYQERINLLGEKLLALKSHSQEQIPADRKNVLLSSIVDEDQAKAMFALTELKSTGNSQKFECRVRREDGVTVWLEIQFSNFTDYNGNEFILSSFYDITYLKQLVDASVNSGKRDRQILLSALAKSCAMIGRVEGKTGILQIMYVRDSQNPFVQNKVYYKDFYKQLLQRMKPLYQDDFSAQFAPQSIRQIKGEFSISCEAETLFSDNAYHWMSFQVVSVRDISGESSAVVIIKLIDDEKAKEYSQRQVLLEALNSTQAATEAKSRFLSNMSHDIRTPLNSIIGMTSVLSSHIDDHERIVSGLKTISNAGQHLVTLISDILDMSQIESGKIALEEEPFNIIEFIQETMELIRPQAETFKLSFDFDLSKIKAENVIGDKLRLRQVLLNILSNAVKYTRSGGFVKFTANDLPYSHEGMRNYRFTIVDNGIGMSSEFLKHIFEPFERESSDTDSMALGSGLGMAITSNLVRLMGGRIKVRSKKGQGSTFIVDLPLVVEQSGSFEALDLRWHALRCLIIDDDLQTCKNSVEICNNLGLRAEYDLDARHAIETILSQKNNDSIGVLIIDWNMPGLNGVEVTSTIRKVIGNHIPIIMLSAHDFSNISDEAYKAGITAYISKPISRSKLVYTLNSLNNSQREDRQEQLFEDEKFTSGRILLAEDNDLNREIAKVLLEDKGLQVEEVSNGEEAVKLFKSSETDYYDIIFMDIQMPVMNGYLATEQIRNLPRKDAKTVPIIALTANAFAEDVSESMRVGMNELFPKPIDPKILARILHKYLGVKKQKNA